MLATVVFGDAPVERVLPALHDGLKSEILFELRLYKRQKGFFAWLGDRPVVSLQVSRVASFDLYTNRYLFQGEDGTAQAFSSRQEFLRRLVVLADYPVAAIDPGDPEAYYVLARARLRPVRIIGPLNIVALFSADSQITTDWVEQDLRGP